MLLGIRNQCFGIVVKNTWKIVSEPREKMFLSQLQHYKVTLIIIYALFFNGFLKIKLALVNDLVA